MDENSKDPNKNHSRIPTDAELEALLDEESDEEFGQTESQAASSEQRAVLREWNARDFAAIYTRFRPHLERHARRFLRNPSQVDEVVQDAFLYLMVTLPELDSELGVLRFLKWKVRLLALDVIRANGKVYHADLEEHQDSIPSENPEMDLEIERAEDAAIVRLALAKLQPRHREVLIASIYEEKSTLEIAEQVGLSENATRQLMLRARVSLKRALVGEVDTHGMTINQILSVAVRKAAYEVKNAGVQTLSVITIAIFGIAAFLNFGSLAPSSEVADAPEIQTAIPAQPQAAEPQPLPTEQPQAAPQTTAEPEIVDQTPATSESETQTVVEVIEETPASETENPTVPTAAEVSNEGESDLAQATEASFIFADPAIDRSPFDPWVVDPIFELAGQSELLLFAPAQDIFTKSQYSSISEVGIWADYSFEADGVSPISDVLIGFVADQQQYFASANQLDFLVSRSGNGLDRYTYVGELNRIRDLDNRFYEDTRMDGVRITLTVFVDPYKGKVVDSSLVIQASA